MRKILRFHSMDDNKQLSNKHIKKWKSVPNLYIESHFNRPRSKTIAQDFHHKITKKVSFKHEIAKEADETVPYFDYRSTMINKVPTYVVNVEDIKIYTDVRYSDPKISSEVSSSSLSTPTKKTSLFNLFESPTTADKIHSPEPQSFSTSPTEYFLSETVVAGEKMRTKSAFIAPNLDELDKGRKKSSRQNLAHFIQTIHNTRPKAELERENAHFHLSEAIIAACTQIKWNKTFVEKYKIPRDCRYEWILFLFFN